MSEGVFGYPQNTANLKTAKTAAFGILGASVSAVKGCIFHMSVVNKSASTAYFVQIHDKATAPANTDVPVWEGKLPAGGEWNVGFQLFGLYLANGLGVAISTTAGVLTLAAADDAVGYARFTIPSP